MNKRSRKMSFGERLVASVFSRETVFFFPREGPCYVLTRARRTGMSPPELSHGTGSRRTLLERQATVPSAGKGHPEPSPSSFQPRTVRELLGVSISQPSYWGAAIAGVPESPRGFPLLPGCWDGGGMTPLGGPQRHHLSGSSPARHPVWLLGRALVCFSQPRLKCH